MSQVEKLLDFKNRIHTFTPLKAIILMIGRKIVKFKPCSNTHKHTADFPYRTKYIYF